MYVYLVASCLATKVFIGNLQAMGRGRVIIKLVSSPDPAPKRRGKGLGTGERFLGCASSAVLFSGS